jgi:mono/diheme cytochrome c family protein
VELQRTRRNAVCAAIGAALLATSVSVRAEEPAKIYVAKCQACHGVDGQSPFPDLMLNDDKWIHGSSVADIAKVIEEGVPGKAMISFKPQLTKAEIDAMAKYVRTLSKKAKSAEGAK